MAAETTVDMMVLAMNIGGDHAANADEFCARDHGREKAARYREVENIGKQRPGFDFEATARRVKGNHPV